MHLGVHCSSISHKKLTLRTPGQSAGKLPRMLEDICQRPTYNIRDSHPRGHKIHTPERLLDTLTGTRKTREWAGVCES